MSRTEEVDTYSEPVRDAHDQELRSGDWVLVTLFDAVDDESEQVPYTVRGRLLGTDTVTHDYDDLVTMCRVLLGNDSLTTLSVPLEYVSLAKSWR